MMLNWGIIACIVFKSDLNTSLVNGCSMQRYKFKNLHIFYKILYTPLKSKKKGTYIFTQIFLMKIKFWNKCKTLDVH